LRMIPKSKNPDNVIFWFRRGLRVHDNPGFLEACRLGKVVYPVYILDPDLANPDIFGVNRYSFMLESLKDLHESLQKIGSRLYVITGNPKIELPQLFKKWNVTQLIFERDPEPYYVELDKHICSVSKTERIKVSIHSSNTLFPHDKYHAACNGNLPGTYAMFCKIYETFKAPDVPHESPTADMTPSIPEEDVSNSAYDVPSLTDMGYSELSTPLEFPGGESEGLRRLTETVISRKEWVMRFEKPNTSPNSLEPSTTVLSPYISFGCVSVKKFYHEVQNIISTNASHTLPPVSLHGQLLWREFFILTASSTPNFDAMEGNEKCIQIPWDRDQERVAAWKEGRTGYPFIDAIMTQLRVQGWIHHLARHSVACFLTRGDLWQHWEEGVKVFDLYLLDSDWCLNNANWQWLSASNFFYQYFRVYSPVAFGKKTDPEGNYIRKWIPALARFPSKYIYEPWKAPRTVQRQSGCVVGVDYPNRIVEHETISRVNMGRMATAYAANRRHKSERQSQEENHKQMVNSSIMGAMGRGVSSGDLSQKKTSQSNMNELRDNNRADEASRYRVTTMDNFLARTGGGNREGMTSSPVHTWDDQRMGRPFSGEEMRHRMEPNVDMNMGRYEEAMHGAMRAPISLSRTAYHNPEFSMGMTREMNLSVMNSWPTVSPEELSRSMPPSFANRFDAGRGGMHEYFSGGTGGDIVNQQGQGMYERSMALESGLNMSRNQMNVSRPLPGMMGRMMRIYPAAESKERDISESVDEVAVSGGRRNIDDYDDSVNNQDYRRTKRSKKDTKAPSQSHPAYEDSDSDLQPL